MCTNGKGCCKREGSELPLIVVRLLSLTPVRSERMISASMWTGILGLRITDKGKPFRFPFATAPFVIETEERWGMALEIANRNRKYADNRKRDWTKGRFYGKYFTGNKSCFKYRDKKYWK